MTTKIEIPAEAWCDWPSEAGTWLVGNPFDGEVKDIAFCVTTNQIKSQYIDVVHGCIYEADGYRFAKIELPIVPKEQHGCTQQSES